MASFGSHIYPMAKVAAAKVKEEEKEQIKIQNWRTDRVQQILFLFAAFLPFLTT